MEFKKDYDCLCRQLNVGDWVIYSEGKCGLNVGKITAFTKLQVRFYGGMKYAQDLIKITKEEAEEFYKYRGYSINDFDDSLILDDLGEDDK